MEELKAAISPQKLNALLCAMNNWRLEVAPKDELNTRYTLHHLFHQLLITGKKNKELFLWLKENEAPFITNRHRLLELLLSQGQQKETLELVEQIKTDSQHFLQLSTELQHPIDEVNPIKTIEHNSQTTPETVQPGILGKAATLAQTAWTWTATNFNFFATQVPVDTAAASSTLGQTKIL